MAAGDQRLLDLVHWELFLHAVVQRSLFDRLDSERERFLAQMEITRWALPAVHELQIDLLAVDPHHLPRFAAERAPSRTHSEICTETIVSAESSHRTSIVVP